MMDRGDRLTLTTLWLLLWTLLPAAEDRSSIKSKVKCPALDGVGGVGAVAGGGGGALSTEEAAVVVEEALAAAAATMLVVVLLL